MEYELFLKSPIGFLTLCSDGKDLTALRFGDHREGLDSCSVLEETAIQLEEYFSGQRREFTIPLNPMGTEFQRAVWLALRRIPYGETATYAEVAKMVGRPKACRAVGGANNRNPLALIVPCHRVIGANGAMTGYAGGIPVKEFLLQLEQKNR